MLSTSGRLLSSGDRTVDSLLRLRTPRAAAAPALLDAAGSILTYGTLLARVEMLAQELVRLGVRRDDRIVVVQPNGIELAIALLAVTSVAIACPLNPAYRRDEFEACFNDFAPCLLLTNRALDGAAREVARARGIRIVDSDDGARHSVTTRGHEMRRGGAAPSDVAFLLHTSGTTARPRMVPLTHANLWTSATSVATTLGLTPADRCLNVMPLFHVHGIVGALLASLAAGASVVCTEGFVATEFFAWLRERGATWYTAVSTMHQAVVARAAGEGAIPALRLVRSSSAALPTSTAKALQRIFRAPVIEAYGMTEAAHQVCSNPAAPGRQRDGSVGLPSGTEIAIVDEGGRTLARGRSGEIAIRGANVTSGYVGATAQTMGAPFGWLRTGDLGRFDADGYLFLEGRLKDIINRGGEKISPREIDEVLLRHPDVAQAVTFAMPDERLGEEIAAAVVLAPGAAADDVTLIRFAAERLADFKIPRRIAIVAALPTGPTGKVGRIGLAAALGFDTARRAANGDASQEKTPLEAALETIWRDVLNVPSVGRSDDFFALGGDSILAARVIVRVRHVLGRELPITIFFDRSTLAAMALAISACRACDGPIEVDASDSADAREMRYPATAAQRQLWFLQRLDPLSYAYNNAHLIRFTGELDGARLTRCIRTIVARHEPLRTHFEASGAAGELTAIVSAAWTCDVPVFDLRDGPRAERAQRERRFVQELARRPFDLAIETPFRAALLRVDEAEHTLVIVIHHSATDRWSFGVLLNELATLYGGSGEPESILAPLRAGFGACAAAAGANDHTEDLAYWRGLLDGERHVLELPADRLRPAVPSRRGGSVETSLDASLVARVSERGAARHATPFVTFLAVFCVLLQRYTAQNDILVGTPIAGRESLEGESLIGLFVNTLPLRVAAAPDRPFGELVDSVRTRVLELLAHCSVPFDRLVGETLAVRDAGRNPFFDVVFDFQNTPSAAAWPARLRVAVEDVALGNARFDLTLVMRPQAGGTTACRFEYNADVFERASIDVMAAHFTTLLESIADDASGPIDRLALATSRERERIAGVFSIAHPPPGFAPMCEHDGTMDSLVARRATVSPTAIALREADGTHLTYADVDRRANRLAHVLRAHGVDRGVRVGMYLERSANAVVAMLATLKAGGAYVPLDPAYPPERTADMLSSAGVRIIVARRDAFDALGRYDATRIDVASEPPNDVATRPPGEADPDAVAYVMFTSGSTGSPKAVAVPHRGVVALVTASPVLEFAPSDVFLLHAPLTFDASTFFWAPLAYGASIVVMPSGPHSLAEFGRMLAAFGVTVLDLTPALFHQLVEERLADLAGLRACIMGGDVLSPGHCARFIEAYPACRVVNGYGPTEATVTACFHVVGPAATTARAVPIGRPTANARAYIVDRYRVPVALGVPGELWLGGDGVAHGYLNDAELSAARFERDPFRPADAAARIYHTGDRARWLPSGEIDFLGRADAQVKIRGFRIEPAEIEFALLAHTGVRNAAVAVRGSGASERELIAYVAGRSEDLRESDLRAYLQTKLPAHAIPARIVRMDTLPMTSSGKLDRARLPDPGALAQKPSGEPPASEPERRLAAIFEQLLRIDGVGRNDDFFALGGHSLLATRALSRIADAFEVEVTLRAFFGAPSVAELALVVAAAPRSATSNPSRSAMPTAASLEESIASLSDAEVDALLGAALLERPRKRKRQRLRCVLLGESTLVLRCAEMLQDAGHDVAAVIAPRAPETTAWAAERQLALFDRAGALDDVLRDGSIDFIFSVINLSILEAATIRKATCGAINLHDAPLPRYAGRYATTWAIAAQETQHGVTWHEMTERVDAGRILKQRSIPIENDTAFSLNLKCYEAALASFSELLAELETGTESPRAQNAAERSYFAGSQRLTPACIIDWESRTAALDAFVRAHDFGRSPNPVGLPKLLLDHVAYACRAIEPLDERTGAKPGTIVRIEDRGLAIATRDGTVRLRNVASLEGDEVTARDLVARHGLRAGNVLRLLADLPAAAIAEAHAEALVHEAFWVERLARLQPLAPTGFEGASSGDGRLQLDTGAAPGVTILAAFCLYLSRLHAGRPFDVDFFAAGEPPVPEIEALYATGVPLRASLDCSTLDESAHVVAARCAELVAHRTYARDVFARYPGLAASARTRGRLPLAVVCAGAARFEDTAANAELTLALDANGGRAELRFRASAGAERAAHAVAHGMAEILRR